MLTREDVLRAITTALQTVAVYRRGEQLTLENFAIYQEALIQAREYLLGFGGDDHADD
jgi:hypothetical protein